MSPKKSFLLVGLSALGLFGGSAFAADPAAPPGQPVASAPASASQPTQRVLLKTDGTILAGTIVEDGPNYLVRQSAGIIPVPKRLVERIFGSIAEVYPYRRASVPENDPDERLKLAKWCLSQNMPEEALAELRVVVKHSPGPGEARAMLANLEASERRARTPQVDPSVVRSGGEMRMSAARGGDARPAEISPSALERARRDLGVSGLPVILDLPPAVAVKRAELFARDVHPIVQAACARCHNEQYAGSFQLIEVKARKGPSGDVLRANLDAVLRLVDADNPARSQLLSSALVPHGNRPNPRPIFRGSNDPRYQILAAWVNSLRAARPNEAAAGGVPRDRDRAGVPAGFAVDRDPGAGPGSVPGTSTTPLNAPPVTPIAQREPEVLPATRYVPGQGAALENVPPTPGEFPLPPSLGGPLPSASPAAAPAAAKPKAGPDEPIPLPAPRPAAAAPAGPAPPALPEATASGAKKPSAPLKIDPDLLQRALENRNSGR